jgi:hypothetical protein
MQSLQANGVTLPGMPAAGAATAPGWGALAGFPAPGASPFGAAGASPFGAGASPFGAAGASPFAAAPSQPPEVLYASQLVQLRVRYRRLARRRRPCLLHRRQFLLRR